MSDQKIKWGVHLEKKFRKIKKLSRYFHNFFQKFYFFFWIFWVDVLIYPFSDRLRKWNSMIFKKFRNKNCKTLKYSENTYKLFWLLRQFLNFYRLLLSFFFKFMIFWVYLLNRFSKYSEESVVSNVIVGRAPP